MRAFVLVCIVTFAGTLGVLTLSEGASRTPGAGAERPKAATRASDPDGIGTTDARVRRLQAAVRARPQDAEALTLLGSAFLQKVRETGDAGYYQRADQAIAMALRRDRSNAGAYTARGLLRLARHDFRGALSDGQRARALAPTVVRPLGVVVDANVELGRYDAAAEALQRMIDLKPNLDSYARVSYFRELNGDIDGAQGALALAVSAGGEAPENAAYVQVLEGNLEFGRGRRTAARRAYEKALDRLPKYAPADFGLARVEAAAGRFGPAIDRARQVVERLPLLEYVIFLGEAELAAGRPASARRDLELVRAQQQLLAGAGVNSDAELAIFEADHGDRRRGVQLGRAAWANAPSVRSADALGWALTRAGRPGEGFRWGLKALRLGSRDAQFLYHVGMSARAAGKPAEARRLLRRALSANPRFSPWHAPRARRALAAL